MSKKIKKFIREKTKGRQELKGTKNISNIKSAKKRILIPEIKNTKGENITTRTGIANVFAEFYEKYMKMRKAMKTKMKRRQTRALKTRRRCLLKSNPSQSSYKVRSKMPSTAPREVKQVTAVEFELNSSKIAATRQKNKSDKSSSKTLCKKIALRRGGEESLHKEFTTNEIQDAHRPFKKEGKRKTAMEYELSN